MTSMCRPDQSMVDFNLLVHQSLSLSMQGKNKTRNSLLGVILCHSIMSVAGHSDIPYSTVQSAMISNSLDNREPCVGNINQELTSKKTLKMLKK